MLPTAPTPPKTDIRDLKVMIYGSPGWGKSSLCSNADGALFIATEPGLNHLNVFQMPVGYENNTAKVKGPNGNPIEKGLTGWEYINYIYKLLSAKPHDFKTVIFDTIDMAYTYCVKHVCAVNGWVSPQVEKYDDKGNPVEHPWGHGWRTCNQEFEELMAKFTHLPMGIFWVSHEKTAESESRTAGTKVVPSLSGGAGRAIEKLTDITLYCTTDNQGRIIKTKPDDTALGKDRTSKLPSVIRVPDEDVRLEKAYSYIMKTMRGTHETK